MYGYIYLTENMINHKKYIGQKKSNEFLQNKYLGSGTYLKNAINKYGKQNFNVTLLDTAETFDELNEKEIYYINKYNAVYSDNFYNMSPGGVLCSESGHIKYHTEETKQKIANSVTGEKNGFYGKHHSDKTKTKLKLAWQTRKLTPVSDETRKKLSNAHKGIKFTEEHKKKIGDAQRGEKSPNFGKHHDKEMCAKISKTMSEKVWLNNGITNARVNKSVVDDYLANGYKYGRLSFKKGSTTIEK